MISARTWLHGWLNSPAIALAIVLALPLTAFAVAGTDRIAEPGKRFEVQEAKTYEWPSGTLELINDEARRFGWHHWFSELPNDANWFDYEVKDTAEINRLIERLAAIDSTRKVVVLSADDGPTRERIHVAVEFSIGSQRRLDEWYDHLPADKRFGTQKLDKAPAAASPELTIYVQHEAVDLDRLELPTRVDVELLKRDEPKKGETPSALQRELLKFVEQHRFRQKKFQ
jgi:hypothetical protein